MSDIEVTTHHFKTHFSALVRDLQAGRYDRVVVKSRDTPVGVFSLPETKPEGRKLGLLKHLVPDSFDWEEWERSGKELDKEIEDDIYRGIEEDWARP